MPRRATGGRRGRGAARSTRPVDFAQPVADGKGQFVAVGLTPGHTPYANILTSPDGATWTISYAADQGSFLNAVAYGNGQFVAVGLDENNGMILTSPHSETWTKQYSAAAALECIAYGNGQFVALIYDGTVLTSADGLAWTSHSALASGGYAPFSGVAVGNNTFVVVANSGGVMLQSGVLPPARPALGSVALLAGGAAQLSLSGLVGQTYSIQASTNLTDWTVVTNLTLCGPSGQFLDPAGSGYRQRFYRAVGP